MLLLYSYIYGIILPVQFGEVSQVTSQESFQNLPVSVQVFKSFHIPVIIGDTVFVTLGVVVLHVQEVVGTDVLGVQLVGGIY